MATKSANSKWGWSEDALLKKTLQTSVDRSDKWAEVWVQLGADAHVPAEWQADFKDTELQLQSAIRVADTNHGVRVFVSPRLPIEVEMDSRLQSSLIARVRDSMGALVATLEKLDVKCAQINFDFGPELLETAIVGLEMALYRFKRMIKGEVSRLQFTLQHRGKALPEEALRAGLALGRGMNLSRHLVNLPPNWLNPVSYADFLNQIFAGKNIAIEVWDETRLKQERMHLHLAVGQGSATPPRLVHLRYRPKNVGANAQPVALVGKGITFDSGGLDIKSAGGMRLMKKDMGGSAAVAGLAFWACESELQRPIDFYLSLAENSISGEAMRPSDVITSRNGLTVEIHNTDAEGRLVLADALDVAITATEKPSAVIDVATLTGAIKTALGTQIAGLFASDNALGAALMDAGQRVGDLSWQMPLVQRYRRSFDSPFADMVNATDGWAGAITAALFLQKFTGDVPWAHFDIYAWRDASEGACQEAGGSGQAVLALAEWLQG